MVFTRQEREESTWWQNTEPYTDIYQVLELLEKQSPTYEPNHLDRCRSKAWGWEIKEPWYSHGSSGGDDSGYYYHQIEPALAQQLVDERLVESRKELRMGYTHIYEYEFVISGLGKEKLEAYLKEKRAEAENLLIPGIHTDLTGQLEYRGHNRDDYGYGELYFKYALPGERGYCHVYPLTGRIAEDQAA